MGFDSGEVLQGLEEEWTFMGANMMELICGAVVFLMIGTLAGSVVRAMPFMIAGFLATSLTLASLRRMFPDEHRGVRNMLTSACGIPPLDIPPPARLQPVWSASPMREVPSDTAFVKLGLDQVFPSFRENLEDADGETEE